MPRSRNFDRLALGALAACALSLISIDARADNPPAAGATTSPPVSGATSPTATATTPPAAAAPAKKPSKADVADAAKGRKIAARVQKYYGKRKDFSAAFAQRYTYAALGRVEEKTGTVQIKRPGMMRWEYAPPEKKLLVLDGKAFWQWSPEDNQVSVKRDVSGEQLSSAFTFLWGKGDLLKDFYSRAVALPAGLPQGDAIELMPKQAGGSVQKIVFVVDAAGRVLASVVTDGQGNENRLVFSEAKIDQNLPDSTFQFSPPAGANVQELP